VRSNRRDFLRVLDDSSGPPSLKVGNCGRVIELEHGGRPVDAWCVSDGEWQDLQHDALRFGEAEQVVELLAHHAGTADCLPEHSLTQDYPELRGIVPCEDVLALDAGCRVAF
jgi:hypothetical protein